MFQLAEMGLLPKKADELEGNGKLFKLESVIDGRICILGDVFPSH